MHVQIICYIIRSYLSLIVAMATVFSLLSYTSSGAFKVMSDVEAVDFSININFK